MRANNQKVYMPREGKLISDINKVNWATSSCGIQDFVAFFSLALNIRHLVSAALMWHQEGWEEGPFPGGQTHWSEPSPWVSPAYVRSALEKCSVILCSWCRALPCSSGVLPMSVHWWKAAKVSKYCSPPHLPAARRLGEGRKRRDPSQGFCSHFFFWFCAGAAGRTAVELTSPFNGNKQLKPASFPRLYLIMLGIPRAAAVGVCVSWEQGAAQLSCSH